MRSACLDRLPVLNHRFDTERLDCARKALALGFLAAENRNRQMITHESFIHLEHLLRLLTRFGFGFVHGMPLLPEKFRRAQKEAGPHLPADDVRPLVDQDRQITITLDPFCVGRADNGFRCWPDNQRLGQRTAWHHLPFRVYFQSRMGDDCAFLCESFHMRGFAFKVTKRNKKGEVGVPMSSRLEHRIELTLHVFP